MLYSFRARVQPNWIAPAIIPLFALAATYWEPRWEQWRPRLKPALQFGFALGLVAVVLLHDTNLTTRIVSLELPARMDPLRRVRAWSPLADLVESERKKLAAAQNEPVFIIGAHYGVTSLMRFYNRATPDIFALATEKAHNQYFFWPNYLNRTGESAIFVQRADVKASLPPEIRKQFESVEDLGLKEIKYRGRVFHTVNLYACRNLKPSP